MGLDESPNPGRSIAITRYESASADRVGRKEALVPPSPCRQRIGSPTPASTIEIRLLLLRRVLKVRRPGCWLPLVAARKPTPRWRLRRMLSRLARKVSIPPRGFE